MLRYLYSVDTDYGVQTNTIGWSAFAGTGAQREEFE
jgi:hypothetical protein